ncbi:aminotransferase class I/II-fold pyridoxal phosphate-dependent enzyme [Synechococcus sp. CS-1324]|uniref:aminotransferase class I/II-fold pyridoxal phosphate-dependent enzyme n=1 Tax=Synechococcus sp. CS-1324 TaxID=2847980 RepID=UPI000DB818A8|nr:aminotransferase class I/II-fold pyridoxal phosphate-dependent enzyme [Synechococcus sp. CS-1324]MCT0229956.1 aminotransferase class I/II-fold pyridoxal phosphate-dependent enzyme [Synechococcus sp. CS-1324]PZV00749.1 MAG: lysine decarboxylase [Cyanobium sp.]
MRLLHALRAPGPGLALHLPAHGRGRGLAPGLRQLLAGPPGRWDLPELPWIGGPLEADGAVAVAQGAAAALCGSDRCWFGVNGASGLLQAGLLALAPPGSRVLLPRNLHRSLLHGCVLAQLRPVLFDLPFDAATGLWLPPTAARLERVLAAAGSVAALVLVHPTYQGLAAELAGLIELAHQHGLPVLVDEAHGAHFGAAALPPDLLPTSALGAGADLVVQSLHKAAGGLGQSAALLLQGGRVAVAEVERALLWLQTTSPSALLLASAEAAITQLHSREGGAQLARALRIGSQLRRSLAAAGLPLVANQDPLRLVLHTAALGISGLQADQWLLERGVIAELPEPGCLTFCLGLHPPLGLGWRLGRRLQQLNAALGGQPLPAFQPPPLPLVGEPELPVGQAWRAPCQVVPLAAAAGRVAAEPVCPYPPGIPLLIPGERIDPPRADWLLEQRRLWPDQIADSLKVVA